MLAQQGVDLSRAINLRFGSLLCIQSQCSEFHYCSSINYTRHKDKTVRTLLATKRGAIHCLAHYAENKRDRVFYCDILLVLLLE